MAKSLNQRIAILEQQIETLQAQINKNSQNTEATEAKGTSKTRNIKAGATIKPVAMTPSKMANSQGQTLFDIFDSAYLPWNDVEMGRPPYGTRPGNPKEGYNNHMHTLYSGGPLDVTKTIFIAYDDSLWGPNNEHCQQFWTLGYDDVYGIARNGSTGYIKKSSLAAGDIGAEGVAKMGPLDIKFDGDTGKWLAGGIVDVETTPIKQQSLGYTAFLSPNTFVWDGDGYWRVNKIKTSSFKDENGTEYISGGKFVSRWA